ncbi:MAG: hypothetical protein HZC16_00455 [Candidatus Omnitrophica bacterium]|nr:hypothetical protein [Candidatus Omnitrophota bacterium]
MISQDQISVLQAVCKKLLVKKSELANLLTASQNGSLESSIESLKSNGYIDILAPMGETSLAITQKGMRLVAEEKEQQDGTKTI